LGAENITTLPLSFSRNVVGLNLMVITFTFPPSGMISPDAPTVFYEASIVTPAGSIGAALNFTSGFLVALSRAVFEHPPGLY